MSYILEALKKAQAERQLGSAPTIHAPAVHAVPAAPAGRTPLVIGAGAGALVLAAAAAFMWQRPAATVPVQQHAAATQPVAPPVPQSVAVPAASAGLKIAPAPQVALLPDPAPAPEKKAAPAPARPPAPPRTAPDSQPAPAAAPVHDVAAPVRASVPVPAPVPAAPAATGETYRAVNDLPEAVRRELPKVVFGGYIYSPNPGESLLLVDKALRREGDEVAPGLVLEKLLPGAALMNYKGFRYRVPY